MKIVFVVVAFTMVVFVVVVFAVAIFDVMVFVVVVFVVLSILFFMSMVFNQNLPFLTIIEFTIHTTLTNNCHPSEKCYTFISQYGSHYGL